MNILAIDTANATCSVTLRLSNGRNITKKDGTPSKQAELLFPLINNLFEETGYSYNKLDRLAVSIGPGSFTGIRIGMAAMQGIALATKLPLFGVTTLEATAWSARNDIQYSGNPPIFSVLDARRKQVYIQSFSADLTPLSEAALIDCDQIHKLAPEQCFFLAGSGSQLVVPWLDKHQFILSSPIDPVNSEAVAAIAALKQPSIGSLTPFYIRKPDATPQKSKLILK